MNTTSHMVTLANGKQVPWDEFSTWSIFKQNGSIKPTFGSTPQPWTKARSQKASKLHIESFKTGRKLTRNFGSSNPSSKAVMTPCGEFPSRKAAALHYWVSPKKMYEWIKSTEYVDFYYIENTNSNHVSKCTGMKSVKTPEGLFNSIQSAANFYEVTPLTIKKWIKNKASAGFAFCESCEANGKLAGSKEVMTPRGKFPSLISASKEYGVNPNTITRWIRTCKSGFFLTVDQRDLLI